ncbi:MAG: hypothetical protein ABW075_13705 [Aeromicrobium sp.]
MDIDEPGWPLIDDFFERLARGRKAETVRRYVRVRHRLYDYLDVDDMTAWLEPADATLLAAEREFWREGAFWTIFGADELVRCLPGFVAAHELPSTTGEARMQISVTGRLLKHVRHWIPDPSMARPYGLAVRAVETARSELDRSPGVQAAIDQINARFLQQPGPEW